MRIAVGVLGLFGFLAAAYAVPQVVGALLMLFSFLVFVVAVTGLIWPPLMRLPNRMAGVWAFVVSVGMFVGGAVLIGPQNGESTASDAPAAAVNRPGRMSNPETPEEREARIQRRLEESGTLERQRRSQMIEDDPCGLTAEDMRGWNQLQIEAAGERCLEVQNPKPAPVARAAPTPRRTNSTPEMEEVHAATWTDGQWPLTINAGVISCAMVNARPAAFIADANGTVWALNGIARAYVPGLGGRAEIRPIWKDDPRYPGTGIKIDIGPLIQRALRLC